MIHKGGEEKKVQHHLLKMSEEREAVNNQHQHQVVKK